MALADLWNSVSNAVALSSILVAVRSLSLERPARLSTPQPNPRGPEVAGRRRTIRNHHLCAREFPLCPMFK
jgi:hypothetical protein